MGIQVFGEVERNAVDQLEEVMRDERAVKGALMADHHLGYSMPIGGVVAYDGAISPTGVGFDIACGNKAVRTNLSVSDIDGSDDPSERYVTIKKLLREIQTSVSFGLGRSNPTPVADELFDADAWEWLDTVAPDLKEKARKQLGTVGSGNHYVDLLLDEDDRVWVANHFGSRGLGHTICSGFMALDAGGSFTDRLQGEEGAVVFNVDSELGSRYVECMNLAGDYAYAGRDYVAAQVLAILDAEEVESVHNHHNFAWHEDGLWVVRKGATPLTPEPSFIGGSMGDVSVIVRGRIEAQDSSAPLDIGNLASAPHGAGRVMSRTKAAGKLRKIWRCKNRDCNQAPIGPNAENAPSQPSQCPTCEAPLQKRRMRDKSTAAIDWDSVRSDLKQRGIVVLGAGADEAPGVYKDLRAVIDAHSNIEILRTLRPIGVVMAGPDEKDPYKD